MITITVAKDFSRYPAGRHLRDGPFTGELFRKRHLEPHMDQDKIIIELDGTRGYGSSFLEEAFGGLVRAGFETGRVLETLVLRTTKPSLREEILEYIREGASGKYATD